MAPLQVLCISLSIIREAIDDPVQHIHLVLISVIKNLGVYRVSPPFTASSRSFTSHNMDQLSIQDDADTQWLKERGVPTFEEPFLQKYLQGRDALINQEKKQRSGSSDLKNSQNNVSNSPKIMLSGRPCPQWLARLVLLSLPSDSKNNKHFGLKTTKTV